MRRSFSHRIVVICVFVALGACLGTAARAQDVPLNQALATKAWDAFNGKSYRSAIVYADSCIGRFEVNATAEQKSLSDAEKPLPPTGAVTAAQKEEIFSRGLLNDVATCYYIKGRSLEALGRPREAAAAYRTTINFPHARCWDPQGWFWSPATAARERLDSLSPSESIPLVGNWKGQGPGAVKVELREGALHFTVDLSGSDDYAELFLDLRRLRLRNFTQQADSTYNLTGMTLVADVSAATDFSGNPDIPNGVQFLVKDRKWKNLLGPWKNATAAMLAPDGMTVDCRVPAESIGPQVSGISLKFTVGSGSRAAYVGTFVVKNIRIVW